MIIAVTGSVCTGKTTLAKKLSKKLKYEYVDVNKIIKKNKLHDSYDKTRKCYVVDIKKLNKYLIDNLIKKNKNLVIDSHLSHYLPKRYVDLCVVTKCELKKLRERLEKRGYSASKVKENLECEIFDVCLNEAKEKGHKVIVIDSSGKADIVKKKF